VLVRDIEGNKVERSSPRWRHVSCCLLVLMGAHVLGSRSDFVQWNADAGLYAWPGYSGISPAMRTFRVAAVSLPFSGGSGVILENEKPVQTAASEGGTRSTVKLSQAGDYTFAVKGGSSQ
jgi:hypothetical protein